MNHFILSTMTSDVLMALVVIPLVAQYLLGGDILPPSTCGLVVFAQLVSVSAKSWSLVAYIILNYVHDGLIPSCRSVLVAIWVWIASALIVVPVIVYQVKKLSKASVDTLVMS